MRPGTICTPSAISRQRFTIHNLGQVRQDTTTYTYDETGRVMSMTDPCGNAGGCATDMPGQTTHMTTYAYTDNPSGGNPAGNSNAYLTQITSPNTGVAHTQSYQYNYASGELAQAVDQNNIITNYSYADPFDRPIWSTTRLESLTGRLIFPQKAKRLSQRDGDGRRPGPSHDRRRRAEEQNLL